MSKYRKKPDVIDAMQVTTELLSDSPDAKKHVSDNGTVYYISIQNDGVQIDTINKSDFASLEDWIVTDIDGEIRIYNDTTFRKSHFKEIER